MDNHLIVYNMLQYYCIKTDAKMGYFGVKKGNKKQARKFYNLLIKNINFFYYSHLADSLGSNSYPLCPGRNSLHHN